MKNTTAIIIGTCIIAASLMVFNVVNENNKKARAMRIVRSDPKIAQTLIRSGDTYAAEAMTIVKQEKRRKWLAEHKKAMELVEQERIARVNALSPEDRAKYEEYNCKHPGYTYRTPEQDNFCLNFLFGDVSETDKR